LLTTGSQKSRAARASDAVFGAARLLKGGALQDEHPREAEDDALFSAAWTRLRSRSTSASGLPSSQNSSHSARSSSTSIPSRGWRVSSEG